MADERQRAVDLAYRALSQRDRTVAEMQAYLESKRVEPAALRHAMDELRRAGFLDDQRFAERFAEDKRSLQSWGSERIAADLRRRGVTAEIVASVCDGVSREVELADAVELLERRHPGALASDRERDRAWRMLVRKGYAPELAYDAVRSRAAQSFG